MTVSKSRTTPSPSTNSIQSIQSSNTITTGSNKTSSTAQAQSKTFIDVAIISILYRIFQLGISVLLHLLVPSPHKNLKIPDDNDFYFADKDTQKPRKQTGLALFPSISNATIQNNQNNVKVKSELESESKEVAQPCSTGLTTRLLPFKNAKGEIEWAFTDDITPGNELDVFKMSRFEPELKDGQDKTSSSSHQKQAKQIEENTTNTDDNLSPTISNSSSNNESILSNNNNSKSGKNLKLKKEEDHETTPLTNHSSPFTPNDEDEEEDSKKGELSSSSSSDNLADSNDLENDDLDNEEDDGTDKVHQCPHCDAVFKIRGYLTRHLKKHAIKKAYSCPFHQFSIYIDENNITHKCHPNGGFSRRDTYKTHLKSRHFKYPKGTKTKDRVNSPGTCSMCGGYFPNAEIWCELHVEGGECKFLPTGFKGKSRIKNRLKKQLSKMQQKNMDSTELTNSILQSHYMNAAAGVKGLTPNAVNSIANGQNGHNGHNPVLVHDITNSYVNTPNSVHSTGTPGPMSNPAQQYEYHNTQSPESVVSSTSHNGNTHANNTPMSSKSPINYSQILQAQVVHQQAQNRGFIPKSNDGSSMNGNGSNINHNNSNIVNHNGNSINNNSNFVPQFEQFNRSNTATPVRPAEDYDDDFCLDIDQLNTASMKNYNEIVNYLKVQSSDYYMPQQQPSPVPQPVPQQQQQQYQQPYHQANGQQQVQYQQQQYQPQQAHQSHFQQAMYNQGIYNA
ncbi:zf-C2H2 zinc finger, C2H2 type [Scheffersomyces xylosifermentans]|uniref:zf-C2H2 zinc finger, C2H2 type n=1 Tax=Scheffersomyces xylosifermentans TaxID=1304137 RepID=UPI00315CF6EA